MQRYFADAFLAASVIALFIVGGFVAEALWPLAKHALNLG